MDRLAAYTISVGGYRLFTLVVASSFIATRMVDHYIIASIRKRGEVVLDEMFVRVAWISGYRAFHVSSITIALILVATLSLEYLNVRVPPTIWLRSYTSGCSQACAS